MIIVPFGEGSVLANIDLGILYFCSIIIGSVYYYYGGLIK